MLSTLFFSAFFQIIEIFSKGKIDPYDEIAGDEKHQQCKVSGLLKHDESSSRKKDDKNQHEEEHKKCPSEQSSAHMHHILPHEPVPLLCSQE